MLGRRRDDPRPPIEVIGGERSEDHSTRVTVGGERGRRSRVLAAGLAAVVAIVVIGATVGGDEEPEQARRTTTTREETRRTTRSTRRVTTSTAPVVTAPHGPQLPEPSGSALLLGTYDVAGRWIHLDLDTGTRTPISLVPDGGGQIPVGVRGGVVHFVGPDARFQPLPSGESVELGPADQGFVASPELVWLVAGNDLRRPLTNPLTARLVEPRTGKRRSREISVPVEGYVAGSSAGGLVVVAGGRIYLLTADGDIDALGAGEVVGTSFRYLVVRRCDDRARCALSVLEPGTGAERVIDDVPAQSPQYGGNVLVSDEGQLVVVSYGPDTIRAWLTSLEGRGGGFTVELPAFDTSPGGWLPGGQGYVALDHRRGRISRYTIGDGALTEHPIPAVAEDTADFVVVIPP